MPDDITDLVEEFNRKHDSVQPWPQFLCLVEEVGELSEEILQDGGYKIAGDNDFNPDDLAEELADVIYISISLASLYDIDWEEEVRRTALENLDK